MALVLTGVVVASPLTPLAAQQRPSVETLDTLVRRYWRAGIANDSLEMGRVTSGEQPRRVMPMFTSSAHSMPTAKEAERVRIRRRPATQFRGDTAWRAYAIRVGESTVAVPYTVRFERRCAGWRIVSVSRDAAAGYPAQPPNDR
jgi:hypothetical protein